MAEVTKAETCHQKLGDTVCIARVRKRPLEDGKYDNETHVKQDRWDNQVNYLNLLKAVKLLVLNNLF